jgi:opine dehydrogenase
MEGDKQMKKIAVLGGGNGAHAIAADLARRGFQVRICEAPEYEASFSTTLERQGVTLIDVWGETKFVQFDLATTDFGKAVDEANCIMFVLPAMGHERFLSGVMPYLRDGQILIIWAANYTALRFAKMLHDSGKGNKVTLAEVHTFPWGCRMVENGAVRLFVEAWKLLVATLPISELEKVISALRDIYPVTGAENVLSTSMNNLNPIVHPVGSVLNAGWIDTLGEGFRFYGHGTTLSVARGIKAVYQEVRAVGSACGVRMVEYPEEAFYSKSTIMAYYCKAPFDKEGLVAQISGPSSMRERYIVEDTAYGLVPVALLARQFGVDTPIINAVIELTSVINEANYWQQGRSLEELGIAGISAEQLKKVLERGFE